jgi:DNA-binding response OmpR family regulator
MKEKNTPATVYVIDDDTALRTAYTAALSGLGYEVKSAIDGQEGQKLIADKKPDLIVLDMLMPNLDGMSFLKQLRKNEDYDQVKVFVVSNFEALPEAEELDVVKYMSKMQHGPDEVAAAVDNILKTA